MNFTIEQLEYLFKQQKELVVDRLLNSTGSYNNKTDSGNYVPLDINKEEFRKIAMSAKMPNDIEILKKYDAK
ncbi:hypothetical protein JJC03_09260 [Flavobacterium oreochromis]|uniref:hypothetical protein n=1 Tax=Flavobacterium oreochromis TaxID=2906078 RepID=UPI001CE55F07|nr:hypothetical protein [Flavobacterium oreochromis]QYS85426.1 hypothetical protein JJC03_09260 [Flavobacterium oreochromis]